jgi:hypothetical protein
MSDFWYYAERDETKGPLSLNDLTEVLKRKPRPDGVLVWRQGFQDWLEAGSVSELIGLLVRPPPLPNKTIVSPLPPEHSQAATPEEKKRNWLHVCATVVGWAIGFALARLLDGAFWIPALLIWVSYWIVALGTNVLFFDEYSKSSQLGASMHVGLRVIGIGLAVYAIIKTKRRLREQVQPE